jgi:hypothetical protein
MTLRHSFAISPRMREFCRERPALRREGVGNAGRQCTRSLACEMIKAHEHSHYGHTGNPAFPHAMVLTVSFVLSPVSRALLPPSSAVCLRQLDTSVRVSGPHDFSVRRLHVRQRAACVHRIPFRVRDDREPPPWKERDGAFILQKFDLVKLNSEIPKIYLLRRRARWQASDVIPGRGEASNPESRDSGFSPAGWPGMTTKHPNKRRGGIAPVAPQFLHSLVQALRAPFAKPIESLAGDPSEVTALGKRHWITSFRCVDGNISIGTESASVKGPNRCIEVEATCRA